MHSLFFQTESVALYSSRHCKPKEKVLVKRSDDFNGSVEKDLH